MTAPQSPEDLERALMQATQWNEATPQLWIKALESARSNMAANDKGVLAKLSKPLSNRIMLGLVAVIGFAFAIGVIMPRFGSVRTSAWRVESAPAAPPAPSLVAGMTRSKAELSDLHAGEFKPDGTAEALAAPPPRNPVADRAAAKPAQNESVRYVVQKATIDLQAEDVRAAFAKAAHLVSEAGGEFVENSSLTGDGKTAQGNMTLRVAAARVGEVMNKLRDLGAVKSENTSGEDVTAQVVDVEARIRNEQRVEKELLELLEKRNDAPLKDVLDLRTSLSSVRESIERLVGQRDRLGRLVSLASILVVIRAEPVAERPASAIGDYFTKNVNRAWQGGLRALSDTVAWLIAVVIGGVMWWIILTAVVIAIVRWRRRLSARCV